MSEKKQLRSKLSHINEYENEDFEVSSEASIQEELRKEFRKYDNELKGFISFKQLKIILTANVNFKSADLHKILKQHETNSEELKVNYEGNLIISHQIKKDFLILHFRCNLSFIKLLEYKEFINQNMN